MATACCTWRGRKSHTTRILVSWQNSLRHKQCRPKSHFKWAVFIGTAGGCNRGGGSLLGQNLYWEPHRLCHPPPFTSGVYELERLADAWYDHFSNFSRFCWLMFASLQHHAFYLLQHQWSVLLRQPKWQVLLALHHCSYPHDASGQRSDPTVHQPLLSMRSTFPGCGCAQPGHHHPSVSPWLAQPVDRILLPYGKDAIANAKAALNVSRSPLWLGDRDGILWVAYRKLEPCSFLP